MRPAMSEPFVTLRSGGISDSSALDSSDDSTPFSTPPSTTHDVSRASFHIEELKDFASDLQKAADRAFPNQGRAQTRYKDVSVLLLRWEDDEMGVDWELQDLKSIFNKYGFSTEEWLIPTRNAHLKLMTKAIEVVERNDGAENLVIIYYAGHALINTARQATWSCKADANYSSLEWSAIQRLFEKASFDVLLLLDCCAAASAAPTVGSAVTETIAACGFENSAPQPGRHSFTNTLIEVLEDWIDNPPFSAAMLHNKVLSVLKHERPERAQTGKRRKVECRRTPIHIMGTADPKAPSIELGKRRLPSLQASTSEPLEPMSGIASRESERSAYSKHDGYQHEDLYHSDEGNYKVPRVIISIALEEDQILNSDSCERWLASCPALIKFATVEAVYKSFSTLLILSVPVFIWNLLPENPACSFVGYATSTNLMTTATKSGAEKQATVSVVEPLNTGKDWDSIVDTCFSGSDVGKPQDWIFDFDSPVPTPESQDRRLKLSTRAQEVTSNNPTFYHTIGLDDFAPWRTDVHTPSLAGPKGSIPDTENSLPPPPSSRGDYLESQIRVTEDELDAGSNDIEMASPTARDDGGTLRSCKYLNSAFVNNPRSAFSGSANPDENWNKISDSAERRRIQNRIAQRNYRKKLKERLEDLERRPGSLPATPVQVPGLPEGSYPAPILATDQSSYDPYGDASHPLPDRGVSNDLPVSSKVIEHSCHDEHSFDLIKTKEPSICSTCHSGLRRYIFECKQCKLKACGPCSDKTFLVNAEVKGSPVQVHRPMGNRLGARGKRDQDDVRSKRSQEEALLLGQDEARSSAERMSGIVGAV